MKFFLACLVWVVMGGIIATGIVSAVHGSVWILVLSVVGFIVAVGKIGCAQ